MEALYKINPSLHKNLTHMKRVGIFTWILGWGIFSNARNIAKIKEKHPYPTKTEPVARQTNQTTS